MAPMDINVMVINVGNTRTAVGAFVAGQLERVVRLPNDRQQEWGPQIRQVWELCKGKEGASIAGASVNPAVADEIDDVVQQETDRLIQWVGDELELPIDVQTDEPNATGVDRVLNMAAAFEQVGKPCAVVDAGTAITVDICDERGNFLGGAIAPGVEMMLGALHAKTAKLPEVSFAVPQGPYGKNTAEAMRQGVYHGIRGMVKELVENYATDLGTWPDLIATGGDAQALFSGWELVHAVSPDLTLYGVALAYANHHIKHGT